MAKEINKAKDTNVKEIIIKIERKSERNKSETSNKHRTK